MKNLIKIAVVTVAMGTMLASCDPKAKPANEKPIDSLKNDAKIDSTKKDSTVKVDSTKKDTSKK
jgi:hypothetical protein